MPEKHIYFIGRNTIQPNLYRNPFVGEVVDVSKRFDKRVRCNVCCIVKVASPAKYVAKNGLVV
jgi:hypothetical protein